MISLILNALGLVTRVEHEVKVAGVAARLQDKADQISYLEQKLAQARDERDEALVGPWPKWASDLLDIIREYTGPCPEDGWEGVDLPEEMRVWLEGYRDEMQRTGNVKPVPQTEWEALKADALLWRNARDKRSRYRKKGVVS